MDLMFLTAIASLIYVVFGLADVFWLRYSFRYHWKLIEEGTLDSAVIARYAFLGFVLNALLSNLLYVGARIVDDYVIWVAFYWYVHSFISLVVTFFSLYIAAYSFFGFDRSIHKNEFWILVLHIIWLRKMKNGLLSILKNVRRNMSADESSEGEDIIAKMVEEERDMDNLAGK